MKEIKKLPDHPADLINLALDALKKCERDGRYFINMTVWHLPMVNLVKKSEACSVCLAGAVMAKSLNVSPLQKFFPEYFAYHSDIYKNGRDITNKLMSLENFRIGDIGRGLECLGYTANKSKCLDTIYKDRTGHKYINPRNGKRYFVAPHYSQDTSKEFYSYMTELSEFLQERL